MKTKTSRAKSFNSKLAAYSVTATAALLVVPAAEATIQNIFDISPNTLDFSSNGFHALGFTAGPFQGSLQGSHDQPGSPPFADAALKAISPGGFAIQSFNIQRFQLSDPLTGSFKDVTGQLAYRSIYTGGNPHGQFLPPVNGVTTGYIGFKALQGSQTYYGWLRVQVSGGANGVPDQISLIAKSGEPNIFGAFGLAADSIKAGEIAPVPEPSVAAIGGLSLLALGAMGVRELRRRKVEADVNRL